MTFLIDGVLVATYRKRESPISWLDDDSNRRLTVIASMRGVTKAEVLQALIGTVQLPEWGEALVKELEDIANDRIG